MQLRSTLERAVEKGDRESAVEALQRLAALEAREPRWPHRLGATLVRLHRAPEAERAYVQASTLYASHGFLARAIAVAKLAVEINPARKDLLTSLDPEPAQAYRRETRSVVPKPAALQPASAKPIPVPPLERLEGATANPEETGFEDAPASCTVEVEMVDFDISTLPDEGDESDADDYAPQIEVGEVLDDEAISIRDTDELDAEKLSRMSGATLFADVPREALVEIAHEAERLALADKGVIFVAGEPADALLVIVEGKAHVRFRGRPLVEVREGDVLGETTILENALRTADVKARGVFVALRVRKAALDRIVAKYPAVGEVLFGLLARRLVADTIDTSRMFAAFDAPTRADIARSFEVRRARAGTVLQEKGKRSDGLYLVLSGALQAVDREGDSPEALPHDALIGHEALVSRAPAPRTVTVASESVLLRLPATKFTSFVLEYPPALAHLAELAASE